jgi:integrase
MANTSKKASKKPGAPKDCALWFHAASKHWCRKVKGRVHYFGHDLDEALKKWALQKDRLIAGLPIIEKSDSPTLSEIANLFLAEKRKAVETKGLREISYRVIVRRLARVIEVLGGTSRLQHLTDADWIDLRHKLSFNPDGSQAAPTTTGHVVEITKILVKWSNKRKLTTIVLPDEFKKPSKQQVAEYREEKTEVLWATREDILKLISAAGVELKPAILLGINCGLGSADIAKIKRSAIDLSKDEIWLRVPRSKNATPRTFWLWPETIQALRDFDAVRPHPLRRTDDDILLLSRTRQRWADIDGNRLSSVFALCRDRAKIKHKIGHYSLRRSLLTAIIDLGFSEHLARTIAGHTGAGVLFSHYVGPAEKQRIKMCLVAVRDWLFKGIGA